jgi:cell division protein FtsI/penicillin-binding protein 2
MVTDSYRNDRRIRVLLFCFIFVFILIASKLYIVQVMRGDEYAERADHQYVSPASSLFDRGSIFFTAKDESEIAAAGLKTGYIIAVNPTRVTDANFLCNKITETISDVKYDDCYAKATKKKDPYEEIHRRADEGKAISIDNKNIPGVAIYKERWRYYPGESTAAQLLGFLSFKDDKLGAFYGLESQYDEVLSRNTSNVYSNFFTQIIYGIQKNIIDRKSLEGDIVTSIEPTVQGYLEDSIKKVQDKWSSSGTGGIIIDPMDGKIYAMAWYPTFDLNNTKAVSDVDLFSNPLVQNVYEMGSIVKPLTVAAGIDAGVITPSTTYDDKGSATYDKKTIYNFDKKARGVIDFQTALSKSLNVGMARVVELLGRDKFTDYFRKYGIGSTTGVDVPYEASPLVKNFYESNKMIEPVTASFGQGIALTPIGITRALSTIANGGYLITPHVVDKINYKVGVSKTIDPFKGEQVIKKETSESITRMLVKVVDEALLDGKIKHEHYAIAAKTGTAQIADPQGGYYSDRYLHSFFGYFPAYNPRFLVFLVTVYPKGVDYASNTLTEPFNNITDFLISYYNLPPDR